MTSNADAMVTVQYYNDVVDHTSTNMLASYLEMISRGDVTSVTANGIVIENAFEELVGFGSALDTEEGIDAQDRVALALLAHSPNRHEIATCDQLMQIGRGKASPILALFNSEGVDYRLMAALAVHLDVLEAFRQKLVARISGNDKTELRAVPFE